MVRRQRGFTLIEVIIVLAISGLIMAPLAAILYQFIWLPQQSSGQLTLVHNLRQSSWWISSDARQAQAFSPGSAPDYGTFTWTDRTSFPVVTFTVRYYYSSAETSLRREQTVGGDSQSLVVAGNVSNYGDVSIQESDRMVTASITVTVDSLRGTISRTVPVKVRMRPVLSSTVPSPPALRLAWDDFESGGWGGGSGWVDIWYYAGDAAVVTTAIPYEGSYHLRLRSSTGYVDRAVNLSGQTKVRLQFWAKANSFEAGETATLSVSPNGTSWTVVRTWVDGQDDNVYRWEDIDLSSFSMTSEFWIAFDAQMSDISDLFYVDDLKVVRNW